MSIPTPEDWARALHLLQAADAALRTLHKFGDWDTWSDAQGDVVRQEIGEFLYPDEGPSPLS